MAEAEQRDIEYISQNIAPDYGLKLEAVGVQDPVRKRTGRWRKGNTPEPSISLHQ